MLRLMLFSMPRRQRCYATIRHDAAIAAIAAATAHGAMAHSDILIRDAVIIIILLWLRC